MKHCKTIGALKKTNYSPVSIQSEMANNLRQRIQKGCWLVSYSCLLYTYPSPRDRTRARMPSSA